MSHFSTHTDCKQICETQFKPKMCKGVVQTLYWGTSKPLCHCFVLHSPSHDFLCGCFDGGVLVAWDASTLELSAVFSPEREDERRSFVSCAVSLVDPYVFFCAVNTKHVSVIDLANKSTFKLRGGSKKPVVAVAAHPSQSILAACSSDGEVRLWDYENQSLISSVEGVVPASSRYFLSFDGQGRHLVVATPAGHVAAWGMTADDPEATSLAYLGGAPVPALASSGFDGLALHPQVTAPPMVLTSDRGVVTAWDLVKPEKPAKDPPLRASGRLAQFSFRAGAALQCAAEMPAFARTVVAVPAPSQQQPSTLLVHHAKNIVTCIPHAVVEFGDSAQLAMFEASWRHSAPVNVVSPLLHPTADGVVWGGAGSFSYASGGVLFLGAKGIVSYDIASAAASPYKDLHVPEAAGDGFVYPIKIVSSAVRGVTAVVYETGSASSPPSHQFSVIRTAHDAQPQQMRKFLPGKTVVFSGNSEEDVLALSDDGRTIAFGPTDVIPECPMRFVTIPDGAVIEDIFPLTPAVNGAGEGPGVVAYMRATAERAGRLVAAHRAKDFSCSGDGIALHVGESPIQVVWQRDEAAAVGAILTTHRVLLVTPALEMLRSFDCAHSALLRGPVVSVHWAGWSLLYTTETHLKSLAVDGAVSCLLSLNTRPTVVCGVLPDRVLLMTGSLGRYTVYSRPLALVGPLVSGELAFASTLRAPKLAREAELSDRVHQLVSRFEWQRLSRDVIDRVHAAGLADIAFAMATHSSAQTPSSSAETAVASRQFEKALGAVAEEGQALGDALRTRHHPIRARVRSLAHICYVNGFPEISRKCFDATGDGLSLLLHHVTVSADARAVGTMQPEHGTADSGTLAAMAKFLGGQHLAPPPAVPQKPPIALKAPPVTPATRATAFVAGKPITTMLWVDVPRHWFPAETLEAPSGVSKAISKPPVAPAATSHTSSDVFSEMLRTAPFPDIPPSLKGPLPKSALDFDEIPHALVDPEQTAVAEFPAPAVEGAADAELEPEVPPLYRAVKKAPTKYKPQPYIPKELPIPEMPSKPASSPGLRDVPPPSTSPKMPAQHVPSSSQTWARVTASPSLARTASVLRSEMAAVARSKAIQATDDLQSNQEYKDARAQLGQQWNARQYDLCLKSINTCIKMIGGALASKPEDAALQKELRQTVAYRVAVAILKEIIGYSGDATKVLQVALLTKFLADLPLHAQHRLDCIRLAIDKNMAAKNFGIAARLIQVLMPHNLPDSKDQAEKFKVCKSHKWSDHQLPPYSCAACKLKISAATPECQLCGTPVKFCNISFKLLEGPVVVKCNACDAVFNKSQQAAGVRCPLCDAGTLEELNLELMVREIVKQKQAKEHAEPAGQEKAAQGKEDTKPRANTASVAASSSAVAAAASVAPTGKQGTAAGTGAAEPEGKLIPRDGNGFQLQAAEPEEEEGQQ